jgi:RNA polymerase sigma factor (TIGR02999 family)
LHGKTRRIRLKPDIGRHPERGMDTQPDPARDTTDLLVAVREGAPDAMDALMSRVYDDLRRVAGRQLGAERAGHTLSPTALVNEAWLRLVDQRSTQWADRAQFFAIAARVMRRILVDHARHHQALRRGRGTRTQSLDDLADRGFDVAASARADELIALDEALARLEVANARAARVVDLRWFAGLTEVEVAQLLGVTERTVRRDWNRARDWLYAEVTRDLT